MVLLAALAIVLAAGPSAAESVVLARDGQSSWTAENRSPDSPPVAFAARELRAYVEKMSGAKLRAGENDPASPTIVLGLRSDFGEEERALLPTAARGFDGYSVYIGHPATEPRILIAGDNPRGVVYATYDILERLGARFVHPALDPTEGEVVPTRSTLELPTGAWSVASPFETRALSWFEWRQAHTGKEPETSPEDLQRQIDWAMKSRYNTFVSVAQEQEPSHPFYRALGAADERGMRRQTAGHNFELFFPNDPELFAKHPEWFGMQRGERRPHTATGSQFCWSHPDAREYFADRIEKFVLERPELDTLGLYGIDVNLTCQCPRCLESSPTDNLMSLMNVVTERLETVAPHVTVETIAGYKHSDKLPSRETPHPRLRGQWAAWGRPVVGSYDDQYLFNVLLRRWAKVYDGNLTAYQYYSDHFAGPWMAAPYAKQITGDRKVLQKLGVSGMLNLVYPDGYWWRQTLNGHLAGRAFYDPSVDPSALLRDYAQTHYGPAGPQMAAYYEDWAEHPKLATGTRNNTKPEQRRRLRWQREKWLEPAAHATRKTPAFANRVEKATQLHALAERTVDLRLQIVEAATLRQRGEFPAAKAALKRARDQLVAATNLAQSLIERNQGLVADTSFLAVPRKRLDAEARALQAGTRKPGATKAQPWVESPDGSKESALEPRTDHDPHEERKDDGE